MIEIYLLEQLDAFARVGTLSRAAEELHVTQPALSRSMKKLEAVTGYRLFERDGKRMRLSEMGKVAARYARRIIEDEREMLGQLEATDRNLNSIVFGSCAPLPVSRLAPALQMEFPDKSVVTRIDADDQALLRGLKDRSINLAALHEQPDDHSVFYQRSMHESLCLYVPRDHPLAGRAGVTLAELADYQVIVHRHVGFWLELCRRAIPPRNLLVQDSMDAMDGLAESSTLAMFNSDAMMKDGYMAQGRIAVPISDPEMRATYYVACLDSEKGRYRSFFGVVRAEAMG
ncbi:MAG: LysR family transcriptional regulator [Coriobacteriales bacterium]|jgi:DNA-binding transcriptional LysR family regulator